MHKSFTENAQNQVDIEQIPDSVRAVSSSNIDVDFMKIKLSERFNLSNYKRPMDSPKFGSSIKSANGKGCNDKKKI